MRAKIIYAVFVKDDIKEAVKWYNIAQKGLGDRFKKHVKDKIDYVALHPESIQLRYENVQIAVLKKFPYIIHFQYFKQENTIQILGVFHTSRSTENWLKRL